MELKGLNGNPTNSNEIVLDKPFNVQETKNQVVEKIKNSPAVLNIVQQINLSDTNSIMNFGGQTAQEIAKFSDSILRSMEMTKVEDSGSMLIQLNKIMEKFDIKDFEAKKPNFFEKIFKKAQDSVDALFKKYHTMGDEVDKVFVTLKQYEAEIKKSNEHLEGMFEKNLQYYEQLQQYIIAGEMALEEIKMRIVPEFEKKAAESGDRIDEINLKNLLQVQEMLEQRIYDLRMAENIALQTMPTLKTIQYGNYNLVRKINSAFIITLPIFKQCLAQSIMLKRQQVQAKAIAALDEKTNELLLRNAENTALQSKMIAQMSSGSFVNIETLEKSWQTIVSGIEETRQIQEEMKQKRKEGTQRLEQLKLEFQNKKLLTH